MVGNCVVEESIAVSLGLALGNHVLNIVVLGNVLGGHHAVGHSGVLQGAVVAGDGVGGGHGVLNSGQGVVLVVLVVVVVHHGGSGVGHVVP